MFQALFFPFFVSIPDEILSTIFWKLQIGDLITASQVCRRWYRIAGDKLVWEEMSVCLSKIAFENEIIEKKTNNNLMELSFLYDLHEVDVLFFFLHYKNVKMVP